MPKTLSKEQKAGYARNLNMTMNTLVTTIADLNDGPNKGKLNEYQRRHLALLGCIGISLTTLGMIQLETADENLVELVRK